MCHNLIAQVHPNPESDVEYHPSSAAVIARVMCELNGKATRDGINLGPQYMLPKGLKVFGDKGRTATGKELKQLHDRHCFQPMDISKLSSTERRKAMDALMFLTEKRDKTVKGRMVYNGKPTREWLPKGEAASPTVSQEAVFLTAIVDAKEERDVMTADIPNAFIQAMMPELGPGKERVIMKITGVLVDLLVEIAPEIYSPFVVFENGKKVLYVQVIRALYGMLIAALLWYKQFRKDLESIGFKFNPHNSCVANRKVRGKRHTVRFHVDDLMSSHVDPKVNDLFKKWLNKRYGEHGEVKAHRGKVHDYLGMTFDWSKPGTVEVGMTDYVSNMLDDFSIHMKPEDTAPTPAAENLFAKGTGAKLDKERAKEFHTFVAKGLFLCKRARPDIHTAIALLTTRVNEPNEDDWKKLIRVLKYLNGTRNDKLILSADDLSVIKQYVDIAFAVHPDFKSQSGGGLFYGRGTPISGSKKQKLTTDSTTVAELVGSHDFSPHITWTKLFMESQGYEIKKFDNWFFSFRCFGFVVVCWFRGNWIGHSLVLTWFFCQISA